MQVDSSGLVQFDTTSYCLHQEHHDIVTYMQKVNTKLVRYEYCLQQQFNFFFKGVD